MNGRFPRSTREAFACERYPAIEGPFRSQSIWPAVLGFLAFMGLMAALGVLAVWRG